MMLGAVLCALVLPASALRIRKSGWTMETPDTVTGRLGSPVTMYCKFTYPHPGYTGNITIMWKGGKRHPVYFKYTNYRPDSQGNYQNVIDVNEGDRYQVIGNPRRNDATIQINQLRGEDNNKKFNCRVELQGEGRKVETGARTRLHVTGHKKKLSSVIGTKGGDATLPCSFTMPNTHQNPATVTVIWRRGRPQGQPVTNDTLDLTSRSNPRESETVNEGNHYNLVGNVRDGDTSLRIRDLELNDNDRYFCHVHVMFMNERKQQDHVTQDTSRLLVVAPAIIVNLSLMAGDGAEDGIVCMAEGEPPATITWIDPQNNTLPVNTSHTPVTHVPDTHLTVGEIWDLRLRGTYHCIAENTQGTDTQDILITALQSDGDKESDGDRESNGDRENGGDKESGGDNTVCIVVSTVMLLVLLTALIIWWVKRGVGVSRQRSESHQMDLVVDNDLVQPQLPTGDDEAAVIYSEVTPALARQTASEVYGKSTIRTIDDNVIYAVVTKSKRSSAEQ